MCNEDSLKLLISSLLCKELTDPIGKVIARAQQF